MTRMLKDAGARLAEQDVWIKTRRLHIQQALDGLDRQFDVIVSSAAQQAENSLKTRSYPGCCGA